MNKESEQGDVKLPVKTQKPQEEKKYNKYVCPADGCDLIPEILKANSDIGKIVLKCRNNHIMELNIDKYFEILEKKQNVEPKDSEVEGQYELEESKNKLEEKCEDLSNIIKTHRKLLELQKEKPENYFHNQNVINLGNFLKEESDNYISDNETDSYKTIDDIKKEEIEGKKKVEKIALKKLRDTYFIDLEKHLRDENTIKKGLYLKLKGPEKEEGYLKYLTDEGFKLISDLRFLHLKEINLANNKITNLDPLNNMLLPHLEIINFSDNEIEMITPLANLLSKNLSEIYLHNNKIIDLGPFLQSEFPSLEIFRVDGEGNKQAFENSSFKPVQKKYKNTIYYKAKSWDYFNKEYEFNCETDYEKNVKLELGSRRKDKILIDLFPLIIYPNSIKSLILDDNKLQDVSLLNRMPLYHLEILDLSLNFITSIKFLKKFAQRCSQLKILYLNDNKINDISPLVVFNEINDNDKKDNKDENKDKDKNIANKENQGPKLIWELDALTLKHNFLDLRDKTTKDILTFLINTNDDKKSNFKFDYEKKDLDDNNNTNKNNNNNNIGTK